METEKKSKKITLTLLSDLFRNGNRITKMLWVEKKKEIIAILFFLFSASAMPFLQSLIRGLLINDLVISATSGVLAGSLILITGFLVVVSFLRPSLFSFQEYFLKLFWFFLEEKFELLVVKKSGEIDVAVYENPDRRNLFNRVREQGIWRIRSFVDRQFYLIQNIIEVLIAIIVIASFNWWLSLIIFAGTLPELLNEILYGRQVWGIYSGKSEIRRKYANTRSHFESLNSIVELKLFKNIPYFLEKMKILFEDFRNEEYAHERRQLRREMITSAISQIVIAFGTVWFVFEVVQGHLQVGTFTFVIASIADLRQSLSSLFRNVGRQYQDNLFVSDIFEFLDLKPALSYEERGISLNPKKTPEIVFEKVTFFYPGTGTAALKKLSLVIKPGSKIAFVGANGAGKTTIIKLLARFYDPTEGRILIDGKDLREIDIASWYEQLGALFQDYVHYYFQVKESIGLGRTQFPLSMEKVKSAAVRSEADKFIEMWGKTYEQLLGHEFSEGVEPSIGQWQKLALARTFYRDPNVFILDEPTSSIDAESEAKIFEKLEKLPRDKTVILISHRFSTVRQADTIAVIEDGSLKELGTHRELLKEKGIYARLFKLQAKGYK